VDSGCSLNEAARRIGCGASSVMRWYHARRGGGEKALRVRFSLGRPHKLTAKQEARLIKLLLKGAMARGYRTNLWTMARIARLIEEEFGVDYHPNHTGRLMHRLKWSHQKPERRAIEYNDQEVEQSVIRSINRVKRSRKKLRACFEGSELPSFLR
jgi:transposase